MRFFNTAGPCVLEDHFMLPAVARLPEVWRLVDRKGYFVLHAPRQSGKTTAMLELARELTERAILNSWRGSARAWLPADLQPPPWPEAEAGSSIGAALGAWARAIDRPLVLFIGEIDALRGPALVPVLRQLRAGHPTRPGDFPWSLALIGLRDVRDYKAAAGGSEALHTSSPFNVEVESLTLRSFTGDEVAQLYAQHTAETGQPFTPGALERAFHLTQGQPWLVNALARQAVEVVAPDPAVTITAEHVDLAKEILIQRQDTHLDSLAERLRESRVRRVVEPILAGAALGDTSEEDRRFVIDLGLARRDPAGGLVIANPIYQEVIPRVLAQGTQDSLPALRPTWLAEDGEPDPGKLLDAYLAFWRRHGQPLLASAPYHEIAPHLVPMAFLHRVVNGGGTLEREYAIGTGRMDLCLRHGGGVVGIELTVWRDGAADPPGEGLAQLDAYLAGLGLSAGWLVVFDRRGGLPPIGERTSASVVTSPGVARSRSSAGSGAGQRLTSAEASRHDPKAGELVVATHGRSLSDVDDLTPLRPLTPEVAARAETARGAPSVPEPASAARR